MNTKNIDFGYLIEQMYMPIGETHSQMIEKYKELPMCLMECIDNGNQSEQIRVDFNKQNASVTYFFNKDRMLEFSYLCFHELSYVDLFLSYVKRHCDIKGHWFISENFCMTAHKLESGTHFFCYEPTDVNK